MNLIVDKIRICNYKKIFKMSSRLFIDNIPRRRAYNGDGNAPNQGGGSPFSPKSHQHLKYNDIGYERMKLVEYVN